MSRLAGPVIHSVPASAASVSGRELSCHAVEQNNYGSIFGIAFFRVIVLSVNTDRLHHSGFEDKSYVQVFESNACDVPESRTLK